MYLTEDGRSGKGARRVNEQDEYAAELGRRVVAAVAPEELLLFDETWRALGSHPERRGRGREEPLGFGLPEAGEVLVTTVASGVVGTVLKDLGKDAGSRLARIRKNQKKKEERPEPLSPERLAAIRGLAYEKARKLGLNELRAAALADALVSDLAAGPARS
jgi:hypothetical protein